MKKVLMQVLGGALLLTSHMAMAASVLDFTASNSATGTIEGVNYTLSATNGNLNWSTSTNGCGALVCNYDGVGITDDEVNGIELLTLEFTQKVTISAISFLDLFSHEVASVNANGMDWTVNGISPSNANGFAELVPLSLFTDTLTFSAATIQGLSGQNDFALASLTVSSAPVSGNVSAVPVPAAALLFAPALLGLAAVRRKKSA